MKKKIRDYEAVFKAVFKFVAGAGLVRAVTLTQEQILKGEKLNAALKACCVILPLPWILLGLEIVGSSSDELCLAIKKFKEDKKDVVKEDFLPID